MKEPLILQDGATIRTVCEKLHKQFVTKFKHAKVWGRSAKFPGQILSLNHKVKDKDIVEVSLK